MGQGAVGQAARVQAYWDAHGPGGEGGGGGHLDLVDGPTQGMGGGGGTQGHIGAHGEVARHGGLLHAVVVVLGQHGGVQLVCQQGVGLGYMQVGVRGMEGPAVLGGGRGAGGRGS